MSEEAAPAPPPLGDDEADTPNNDNLIDILGSSTGSHIDKATRALHAADSSLSDYKKLQESVDAIPPPLDARKSSDLDDPLSALARCGADRANRTVDQGEDMVNVNDDDFLAFLSDQNASPVVENIKELRPDDDFQPLEQRRGSHTSVPETPGTGDAPTPINPRETLATPTEAELSSMYHQVFSHDKPAVKGPTRSEARVQMYKAVVAEEEIDLPKLRALAFQGIPDAKGLRSEIWKILLGYLPCKRRLWEGVMAQHKNLYNQYVTDVYVDPKNGKDEVALVQDHPLNPAPKSEWKGFFEDRDLMEEIEKDIRRTLPDLHFFNTCAEEDGMTVHYEALRRMLFVYAKLNPATRYTQGMNELLAPLYYLFATAHHEPTDNAQAEVDAFFCFTLIMSDIRDLFTQIADKSDTGVHGWLSRLDVMIKERDLEVWQHLEALHIPTQFYALRWLTLMLSQEFELPDVFRIWDSLFAYKDGFEFLLDICSAMVVEQHERLLEADFAGVMKLLQHYPPIDVNILVDKAQRLQAGFDVIEPVRAAARAPKILNKEAAVNLLNSGVSSLNKVFYKAQGALKK